MNFTEFTSKISNLKTSNLGGLEAQFLLAPKLRLQYDTDKIAANNPKKAAVLALFYPNKQQKTTLLLTQRASYIGTHSAQISFPGGKLDKNDANLQETALRETHEEVGIHPKSIEIIRELTDVYIPPSNFLATPFIGMLSMTPNFVLNHEVAKTIEISVNDLLDENNISSQILDTSYMKKVAVPCFKINGYVIWGATAMMLSEIKELLK
jgi:8-oxo-dGTP pyrophosphatase MutT (NUDIX family)